MTRVGCTGHQSLSTSTRRHVAAAIAAILAGDEDDDLVGLSSLAEGADQLFALAVLAAGGQLHAVIPSQVYEQSFKSKRARDTYTALLGLAEGSSVLAYAAPTEDAFLAAGHEIADRCDVLLAVWDGRPAGGKGGTADIVAYAQKRGIETRIVWPSGARRR